MPLYFVDFSDGRTETCDGVGTDMPDPEAARDEVMRMLVDTARFGAARSGSGQRLVATIRDGADRELYRVVLALTCSQPGQEVPREGAATHGRGKNGKGRQSGPARARSWNGQTARGR